MAANSIDDHQDNFGDVKQKLVASLLQNNCVKTGQVVLKSGQTSNLYINAREVSLYPETCDLLMKCLTKVLADIKAKDPSITMVGVPYGVMILVGMAARDARMPVLFVRKEEKKYGPSENKDLYSGRKFVLVEDVMSTGSSIIETIEKMDSSKITDIIVLVDRELGGSENLAAKYPNIKLHSLLKISDILPHISNATV